MCKDRALEAGTATEEELRKKNLWEQIELLKRYVPENIVDNLPTASVSSAAKLCTNSRHLESRGWPRRSR